MSTCANILSCTSSKTRFSSVGNREREKKETETVQYSQGRIQEFNIGWTLLILKFNRHNKKIPKVDIHYLYNQKVTNKKLVIVFSIDFDACFIF
jgi:hypothetical protein